MGAIVIAGGTGFLGNILTRHFAKQNKSIVILTRGQSRQFSTIKYVHCDESDLSWCNVLEGAEALINLNGRSVDCRYTEKNKNLIYTSRINPTIMLGEAIQKCKTPPKVWLNASSATIYEHAVNTDMDEISGVLGNRFSEYVCKRWEEAFLKSNTPQTRKVILRTGMVLGRKGGPLIPLKKLVRIGLGGHHGNGSQMFSWIHESDFAHAVDWLIANESLSGNFNLTTPNPISNDHIMQSFRKFMKVPFGVNFPVWILEVGAFIMRTETELLLKSRRVVPRRLLESGFTFEFDTIDRALHDLLAKP